MAIKPEGKLEVSVYDVDFMEIPDINEKIGWIENGIKNPNKVNKNELIEKEIEKNIRENINNLRMNPSMYYEKYISFNTNYLWTKEYLDKIENEPREPLHESEISYNFLMDYFNNQQELKKILIKKI